jgi:ABC-2 type transport system ATP-binding protein
VLGNHVTPVRLNLDGKRHTVNATLESIAHTIGKGQTLTLQLVATTVAYAQPRLGGSVDFKDIALTLPVRR